MQVIKWFDSPYFEQHLLLGDSVYILECNWNIRDETWNVSLYTNDNVPLVVGKRLNINTDILSTVYSDDSPKGYLIVLPIAKDVTYITRYNMGSEVNLVFVGYDEVL
jgi:hypothetical protein